MTSVRLRLRLVSVVAAIVLAVGSTLGGADTLDQTARLAALGRVWGLLKYFHPQVARGAVDWDAVLVAEVPRIKAAETKPAFNDEIERLIATAGAGSRVPDGAPVDRPEADRAFSWLDDEGLFERSTIEALKAIRHGDVPVTNRYVKPVPNVLNPDFSGETPYDTPAYPQEEMRLLALFRFWNMFQYFAPNRDITDRDWSETLPAFVPRFLDAVNALDYHLTVCELTASINDAHASTSSATLAWRWGGNVAPIRTRFIELQTVVTKVFESLAGGADVRPGDIVTNVDGVDAAAVRDRLRKYVWASNEGSLQRNIDGLLLRTPSGSITLGISRYGVRKSVTMITAPVAQVSQVETALEATRPKWQMLAGNVGYVHMGLLQTGDVAAMMAAVRSTRAIVFDVRNYPNGTLYLIAQQLNPAPREFVRFTRPRYEQPGTMLWEPRVFNAGPASSTSGYYRGRVILLGDDRTQSHAEFTMMALRTAPDVTIVGSATAGADGNVSLIALPGGIRTYFSGLGVFYPDGAPTQRVGIVPDILVTPTIEGIQNGVDEVLERALALVR